VKLTITIFLSLDGAMQAPGGANEDPSGGFLYGGWVAPHADTDMGAAMAEPIDEYRLLTFPVILGSSERLFGPGAAPVGLEPTKPSTTSKGVVISFHRRAGSPLTGSFQWEYAKDFG
jgi:hypothetical protein